MRHLDNQAGAAYLVTVLMVALGLGGAAIYSTKDSLTSTKAVSSDIKKSKIESEIQLSLSHFSKEMREELEKGTDITVAPHKDKYKCDKDSTVHDSQWIYTTPDKTEISCKIIVTGDKVGYLISGSKEVQKRKIVTQLFLPFKVPIGYVKMITSPGNVTRKNMNHSEIKSSLTTGAAVFANDLITTKSNARIHFSMKDKTQIILGPNSNFAFTFFNNKKTKGSQGGMYYLLDGYVRALFKKINCEISDCSGYELRTRNATLGIRGTEIAAFAKIDEVTREYKTLFTLIEGGPVELLYGRPETRHVTPVNGGLKLPVVLIGGPSSSLFIKSPLSDFKTGIAEPFKIDYIQIDEADYGSGFKKFTQLHTTLGSSSAEVLNHELIISEKDITNLINPSVMVEPITKSSKATNSAHPDWKNTVTVTIGSAKHKTSIDDPIKSGMQIQLCKKISSSIYSKSKWINGHDGSVPKSWKCNNCGGWDGSKDYEACSEVISKPSDEYSSHHCTPWLGTARNCTFTNTSKTSLSGQVIDFIDITTQTAANNFLPLNNIIPPDPVADPTGDGEPNDQTIHCQISSRRIDNNKWDLDNCIPAVTCGEWGQMYEITNSNIYDMRKRRTCTSPLDG